MADSDRQTDEWEDYNLREKGEERKREQKWTYSMKYFDRAVL